MSRFFAFSKLLRVLRQPDYGFYVLGNSVSLIGTWIHRVATGWLVWEMTGSPAMLGIVAFVDLAPGVIIAPFAGVAADRWNLVAAIRAAQLLGFLIVASLSLIFFTGYMTVPIIIVATLLLGVVDASVQPSRLSFVSVLVARNDLSTAVAIQSITFNLARFAGPAIAGVVLFLAGVGWAFVANAMSFLFFFVVLASIRVVRREASRSLPGSSVMGEAWEGARYAFSTRGIGIILLVFAATSVAARPVVELLPAWAGEIFGGGVASLASLTSALGLGAMVAGVWLAGRDGLGGMVRVFVICCSGLVVSLTLFALSSTTLVALPLMAVAGFFLVSSAICTQTLIQMNVAEGFRGRVLSIYSIILRGGPAFGALGLGIAADHWGLRIPLILAMLLLLAVIVTTLPTVTELERVLEPADD